MTVKQAKALLKKSLKEEIDQIFEDEDLDAKVDGFFIKHLLLSTYISTTIISWDSEVCSEDGYYDD